MTGVPRQKPSVRPTEAGLGPHWLTLGEAADRFGTSRDRVRGMLRSGTLPNAVRDLGTARQPWRIPIGDLLNAGLAAIDPNPQPDPAPPASPRVDDDLRQRLSLLEREIVLLVALAAERRPNPRTARRTLAGRGGSRRRVAGAPGLPGRRSPPAG